MASDPRTATIEVERALRDTIALALHLRRPAVANVAALRSLETLGASGTSTLLEEAIQLVPVTGGSVYKWSETSAAADDGSDVVKPTDRGALPGRWLKTTSSSSTGYLQAVRVFEGADGEEPVLDRLFNKTPWVLVIWKNEQPDRQSQIPGAFYRVMMDFEIWCGSRNLRHGNEALLGSSFTGEAAIDPGVLRLVADVRDAIVRGNDLGLPEVVDYCYPGAHKKVLEDLQERYFVHSLAVRVPATLRFEDAAGEDIPIADPSGLTLQHEIVNPDDSLTEINPGDPDQVPPP